MNTSSGRPYRILIAVWVLFGLTACGKAQSTAGAPSEPAPTSEVAPTATQASATADTLSPPAIPTPSVILSLDADGSGDYATLEDAVEGAPEGAAIQLSPGTYHVQRGLKLTRSIQLLGSGMDTTMIMTDFTTAVPAAVTSSGEWFVARDLTFRYVGDGGTDLVWAKGAHSVIERCRFQGAKPLEDTGPALGAGLRIGAGEAYVADSEFKENMFGLLMEFDAGGIVRGNTARGNGVGLGVFGEGQPTLLDNASEGNDLGIGVFGQAQPRLEGNLCVGNQQAGISVAEQAKPIVIRNRALRNDAFGIAYADTASGTASDNECSQNQAGIFVSDQARPILESNRCNENLVAGIAYSDSAGGRARANVCLDNPFGIWIRGEASPELVDNQCPDKSEGDQGD